ncbi:vacuolar iron transporter-like protein [Sesbania bispinosa]|nr:vacuolar iron transporter-like protein [Sesbania bispinosa]
MEVIANQWNSTEAENEVEEIMSLQPRRVLQHSISSDKDTEVKGEGLEFDESETKENFEVIRTEVNAEMVFPQEDIENSMILPASDPSLPVDSTSLSNVTTESGTVSIMKENDKEREELYLERVFQKPPTHGFYCPNCKACIQKVYIQREEWEQTGVVTQPLKQTDTIRCSSCFSFLIPIGSWLFPGLVSNEDGALNDQVTAPSSKNTQPKSPEQTLKGASQLEAPEPDQSGEVSQSVARGTSKLDISIASDSGKQTLQITKEVVLLGPGPQKVASEVEDKINDTGLENIPGNNMKSQDSSNHLSATSQDTFLDQKKVQVAPRKKHFWSDWAVIGGFSEASVPKQPETVSPKKSDWRVIDPVSQDTLPKQPEIDFADKIQPELVEVKVEVYTGPAEQVVPSETESTPLLTRREPPIPASSKTLEILKSIVYGGLTESLASLSVVTSAASADATTLNIVALAIANLIGGLFALGHSLRELKADQPKRAENNTDARVDQYNELLGQRENFFLHAFIAILSFIVFGLVPPVVYGFSFRESDDKDFKLAAVAGASLLCITVLSIAKAHIKRPNSYSTYFQTVFYYVSTGALASVLSYLAGDLVKKLIERLGWFEKPASNFALQIPGFRVQQPGLGSY